MQQSHQESVIKEGTNFPGKTYAEVVLEPAYIQAKNELLSPMMAVNKAHLIMLAEQGLIPGEEGLRIAAAIQTLDLDRLRRSAYTGQFEDLFFEVEHELLALAGDAAGNLHLARSRNDMGIAIYRIVLREKLLNAIRSALLLHRSLRAFAWRHRETVMVAHTHTQQAQPTTLAHYIAAVSDSLERDIRRLRTAFAGCNRSSLGAAALATSGFAVSRERAAELLAFDGLVENSYDAVSGADYAGEAAAAVQLAAVNLGRFIQDLLLWCTQEFAVLRVADPYVQVSSIMPQKRNPVSIEHMRSLLSACAGDAGTVLSMIHNTPFGDIVDTEDDMQPYAWKSAASLEAVYRLLTRVIESLDVNADVLLERARRSFAPVTELADTLVRAERLSFRTAHAIVSRAVSELTAQGASVDRLTLGLVNEAAAGIIGRPLQLKESELRLALDPIHFVRIRSVRGGPAPAEIGRALQEQERRLEDLQQWAERKTGSIERSLSGLDETLAGWTANS
ncbi:argininosuccinate lyase [Paenibacillus beijingensis]|uniref:argininosuccinate lyase n=1 Tax=Paenibacillus beijingensis TaxID=1126833 RepID=UPI000A7910B1|nr:argininosuccinate lyase [Paenibacillus beijingensis]